MVEMMQTDGMMAIDGGIMVTDGTAPPCESAIQHLTADECRFGAGAVSRHWLIRAVVECRSLIGALRTRGKSLNTRIMLKELKV